MLTPMLANALDVDNIERRARGYWMEPKLDGVRCVANYKGEMYSRSAKTALHEKLPVLSNAVRDLHLPQGVWLDGELGYRTSQLETPMWPILDFNRTMRVIGSGAEEAIRKQKASVGMIEFFVFDYYEGPPTESQAFRSDGLRKALKKGHPLIVQVNALDGWDEETYDTYVLNGGEGVILKNPSALYTPGKRPANVWYKIKKFDTFEGQIVDYEPGQGKYEGQVGALVVRHPNGTLVRCSGMDDVTRLKMSLRFSDYFDRMVEVKFFGNVGATGEGIRHPQYLRMRPDLDLL